MLKSFFLPHVCILCRQISHAPLSICQHCLDLCPSLNYSCNQCGIALSTNEICEKCHSQIAACDEMHVLFLYQPPITKLIWQLKFNGALANAKLFGDLFAKKVQHAYLDKPLPQLFIPVPLHKNRLKERGFNQSLEIARPIAKKLKIPIDLTPQRGKYTMPQATLPAKDRILNVKDAFVITREYTNMHIAVIDDVITTGHTVREFCRELKKAGVKRIDMWCCARPIFVKI